MNAGGWTTDRSENNIVEQPALPRNLRFPLPAGQIGNATAMPQCDMPAFLSHEDNLFRNSCPDETAIGVAAVTFQAPGTFRYGRESVPVFNLTPAFGEPARFGFMPGGDPVLIDTSLDPDTHQITASVRNVTQAAQFFSSTLSLWGYPSDPRHDNARGWACTYRLEETNLSCERPSAPPETAFLRMPVNCNAPLDFGVATEPWNVPIGSLIREASSQGDPLRGCQKVPFDPQIEAAPTSKLAENPSGLTFNLNMPNSGLLNPEASAAEGQPKKVEVTLPEGVTVNPSQGDGLVGCSPAQYASERFNSRPGEGCPEASKVGTVSVTSPLLKEEATGALFIAAPHDNPFDSLLGLYLIARIPQRGILVKLAGKVDPDPRTGQLTTTFDDLPQLPFTTFKLHFREGGRAPLVTPPTCGTYTAEARFVPWSAQDPSNPTASEIVKRTASFQIERGVDGGACPSGDTPPFHPGLIAGTINNAAGRFSPFNLRLSRKRRRTGVHPLLDQAAPGDHRQARRDPLLPRRGDRRRRDHAPASTAAKKSSIARAARRPHRSGGPWSEQASARVLTYVPGKIYLAGPYNGAPLSIVAITAAKVGPFDLGTVVIREALPHQPRNRRSLHRRRPAPTRSPTSSRASRCTSETSAPTSIAPNSPSTRPTAHGPRPPPRCSGSGLDFASRSDDSPITVTSPFQAADCAALPFKPKLDAAAQGRHQARRPPRLQSRP